MLAGRDKGTDGNQVGPERVVLVCWALTDLARVIAVNTHAGEFLELSSRVPLQTTVMPLPLARANDALDMLRHGRVTGAAVLVPGA